MANSFIMKTFTILVYTTAISDICGVSQLLHTFFSLVALVPKDIDGFVICHPSPNHVESAFHFFQLKILWVWLFDFWILLILQKNNCAFQLL